MNDATRRIAYVVTAGAVIVLVVALLLHVLRVDPGRQPGINTDALGPSNGEEVDEYLAHSEDTLAGETTAYGDDGPRWALVTLAGAESAAEAARIAEPVQRVSRVVVQSPREGLAMPVMWQDVVEPVPSADQPGREGVFDDVLSDLADGTEMAVDDGEEAGESEPRSAALAMLSVDDIRGGVPVIIGLVVRSATTDLREVADDDGVRSVEALPGDAVWGRFAVRPLLPQQAGVVAPLPDHAEVPGG